MMRVSWAQDAEMRKLDYSLCAHCQVEYQHCRQFKLSKCMEANVKHFNDDLKCPSITTAKNISELLPDVRSGKEKYDWSGTCKTVDKEFIYCKSQKLTECVASMQDRYDYLNCRTMLEHRIGETAE